MASADPDQQTSVDPATVLEVRALLRPEPHREAQVLLRIGIPGTHTGWSLSRAVLESTPKVLIFVLFLWEVALHREGSQLGADALALLLGISSLTYQGLFHW